MVLTSGSPSPFLPKKPPRDAIILTASLNEWGFSGGWGFLLIVTHKDCHSCGSKKV